MAVASDNFFRHFDDFFNYRNDIYEISPQTVKSNRVDLDLFKNFICSQKLQTIDGLAVIDFQYYLKKQRQNCGASVNRKLFTLRSYGNFLKLYDLPCADALPFLRCAENTTRVSQTPKRLDAANRSHFCLKLSILIRSWAFAIMPSMP